MAMASGWLGTLGGQLKLKGKAPLGVQGFAWKPVARGGLVA